MLRPRTLLLAVGLTFPSVALSAGRQGPTKPAGTHERQGTDQHTNYERRLLNTLDLALAAEKGKDWGGSVPAGASIILGSEGHPLFRDTFETASRLNAPGVERLLQRHRAGDL